ncbi:hypothetical protein BS47DRAFT_566859 [Hydnum rufescens UP504]|uniref:Uncharacterized protein n=1 Tax=Hydnum rufescens UP504 TaxID=1448309 RepID=A0A9P6B3N0_9AGAM|nr:hypothetical protein BS47DRAFT_566859 [Hydnum rufescens UP504]
MGLLCFSPAFCLSRALCLASLTLYFVFHLRPLAFYLHNYHGKLSHWVLMLPGAAPPANALLLILPIRYSRI